MSISTDWGYNESDLPSKFCNVPLSVKAAMTTFGRHFGSWTNTPISVWFNEYLDRETFLCLFPLSLGGFSYILPDNVANTTISKQGFSETLKTLTHFFFFLPMSQHLNRRQLDIKLLGNRFLISKTFDKIFSSTLRFSLVCCLRILIVSVWLCDKCLISCSLLKQAVGVMIYTDWIKKNKK